MLNSNTANANPPNRNGYNVPVADDQADQAAQAQMQALVLQAMQASLMPREVGDQTAIAAQVPAGSGKFLGMFESHAARQHRRTIEHNRDVAEETLEALGLASIITTDFVAQSFDFEASAEQLIKQYSDSPMVMGSAPVYVQIARQMLMQYLPGISQAGIGSIRRTIERR